MATHDGTWLITPDGLRSPDRVKADADLATRTQCCGQNLRLAPDGWICTVHGGSHLVDANRACDSCGHGYCDDCLKDP